MPLFMVRWENGDLSFVKARSKDDAVILLDEVGDANGHPIRQIGDEDRFMLNLRLDDSGELEFESFSEVLRDKVMEWGYPILNKNVSEDGDFPREAVKAERNRVKQHVTKPHPIYRDYGDAAERGAATGNMRLKGASSPTKH